jgi:hypothetical protein
MASLARVREIGGRVIGIGCPLIVGLMARHACRRRVRVARRMTGDTCRGRMCASQWERRGAMIERRRRPG